MNDWLYVMLIEKTKMYNRLTKEIGRASCRERVFRAV